MKLRKLALIFIFFLLLPTQPAISDTIDVLIKGVDDGVKTNKQQDYKEAVMNAKLEAIERAGVEISSITKVVNFKTKYDMVESKAEAALLPGFQIMDMGYQKDGTYTVVLSGKVMTGEDAKNRDRRRRLAIQQEIESVEAWLAKNEHSLQEADSAREREINRLHRWRDEYFRDASGYAKDYGDSIFMQLGQKEYHNRLEKINRTYRQKSAKLEDEQTQLKLRLSELRVELAKYPSDAEQVSSPQQDRPQHSKSGRKEVSLPIGGVAPGTNP
jgi:chaperonin cofactor prefoldin